MFIRRRPRVTVALAIAALVSAVAASSSTAAPLGAGQPASGGPAADLERAHAHNDYEHDRPLHDALSNGFKSVEADVWLVDGELLVAHDRQDVQSGRTLESLYLRPLRDLAKRERGSIHPRDPDTFTLLVDIKSEAAATYLALHTALRRHRQILTRFAPGDIEAGAVTAIVSGNRPGDLMRHQRVRYAGYDGRLSDLAVNADATFVPLISDNWTLHFTWQGIGPMPAAERAKLDAIVRTAHANGQRVRFWATPETPPQREALWQELLAADVDYINSDHLQALGDFLRRNDPHATLPHVSWEGPPSTQR